jgi:hypothetical protein
MLLAIATISLLFPLQTADPPLHDWKEVSPPGSGFRVKSPDAFKERSRTVETPKGAVKVTLYGVERDAAGFIISRTEYPPGVVDGDPKKVLDEARDVGVRNCEGTLREEKEIALAGHPGREMIVDVPESRMPRGSGGGVFRARVFLIGPTHYSVGVLSSKAREKPEEVKAFMDSFRFNSTEVKP